MSEEICDGVKMLIERMQTNPEDFEYGGKLHGYRNTMEEVLHNPPAHQPVWFLNETEKKALIKAYTDMHKQVFTTGVVQAILNPPKPEWDVNMDTPYYTPSANAQALAAAAQAMGHNPSTLIAPPYMVDKATELLETELKRQYAKNRKPRP